MIKLIVTDLDGTLFNIFHNIDRFILKAIDSALEQGVVFVFATGRALHDQGKSFNLGKRPLYLVASNGAVVYNPKGEVLYEKQLPKDFIKETLEKFPNIAFDFISTKQSWVNLSKEKYIYSFKAEKWINRLAFRVKRKRFLEYFVEPKIFNASQETILAQPIIKVNCRIPEKSLQQQFKAHLKQYPQIVNLPFSDRIYELTAKEVNKAQATLALCQALAIQPEEVVAFGDGGNDIPLFKTFQHSYATMNASQKTKKYASNVIGHYFFYSVSRKILELMKKQKAR